MGKRSGSHGPDSATRRADLRSLRRFSELAVRVHYVVKPHESPIKRVLHTDRGLRESIRELFSGCMCPSAGLGLIYCL